jgi:hypothetical protein
MSARPRIPSPAKRLGQSRSPKRIAQRARWITVTRVLVRDGGAELFTDGIREAEITRSLESPSCGLVDPVEAIAFAYGAEHPRAFVMWCRRNFPQVRQIVEGAARV